MIVLRDDFFLSTCALYSLRTLRIPALLEFSVNLIGGNLLPYGYDADKDHREDVRKVNFMVILFVCFRRFSKIFICLFKFMGSCGS